MFRFLPTVASSVHGFALGTGILILIFAAGSLWSGTSIVELLTALREDRGEASLILQRIIFLIYALICAILSTVLLRSRLQSNKQEVKKELENLKKELRGRVLAGQGFLLGELSRRSDELEPLDPERLEQAIDLCWRGYRLLKGMGRTEYMAINNLVFYLSIQGNPENRDFALSRARKLKILGEQYNSPDLLLTYCRAILRYEDNPAEINEAQRLASEIAAASKEERFQKEAQLYLRHLKALQSSASGRA